MYIMLNKQSTSCSVNSGTYEFKCTKVTLNGSKAGTNRINHLATTQTPPEHKLVPSTPAPNPF